MTLLCRDPSLKRDGNGKSGPIFPSRSKPVAAETICGSQAVTLMANKSADFCSRCNDTVSGPRKAGCHSDWHPQGFDRNADIWDLFLFSGSMLTQLSFHYRRKFTYFPFHFQIRGGPFLRCWLSISLSIRPLWKPEVLHNSPPLFLSWTGRIRFI
jgi:hypothetical protein